MKVKEFSFCAYPEGIDMPFHYNHSNSISFNTSHEHCTLLKPRRLMALPRIGVRVVLGVGGLETCPLEKAQSQIDIPLYPLQ